MVKGIRHSRVVAMKTVLEGLQRDSLWDSFFFFLFQNKKWGWYKFNCKRFLCVPYLVDISGF